MPESGPPHLLPPAIEMTDGERKEYERESLEAVQRRIEGSSNNPRFFHQIQEARIVGEYPETAIFVRWLDTRDGKERDRSYHLWINPVTRKPPGSFAYEAYGERREPPSEVGMLIHTWISES